MIDKSIRQHYEEGKKVNVIKKGIDTFTSKAFPTTDQGTLDVAQLAKNVVTNKITNVAAKKLAGTGILGSLGPIGLFIAAFLARKGIEVAKGKIKKPKDIQSVLQSFQAGMIGSPKEQKELNKLEKRRTYLLDRKEKGKSYSENNLNIVTRAIAEAKGIDVNNPNEMKNIDKDISRLYSKKITEKTPVIPDTPEIISPHLAEDDKIITPLKISPISYEDDFAKTTIEDLMPDDENFVFEDKKTAPLRITPTTSVRQDPDTGDASIAEKIAAENRAAEKAAAQVAAAQAAAARAVDRHRGGGNGGNQSGGGGGQAAADRAGGSAYSSPFLEGGRVDKPLTGRSRDI